MCLSAGDQKPKRSGGRIECGSKGTSSAMSSIPNAQRWSSSGSAATPALVFLTTLLRLFPPRFVRVFVAGALVAGALVDGFGVVPPPTYPSARKRRSSSELSCWVIVSSLGNCAALARVFHVSRVAAKVLTRAGEASALMTFVRFK